MTQTSYPISPEKIYISDGINLSRAEEKLILRLRQSKRKGDHRQFIIDPLRMTLTPVEVTEIEELSKY